MTAGIKWPIHLWHGKGPYLFFFFLTYCLHLYVFAVKGTRYVLFCPKRYIMYNKLLYVFAVKDTRFWLLSQTMHHVWSTIVCVYQAMNDVLLYLLILCKHTKEIWLSKYFNMQHSVYCVFESNILMLGLIVFIVPLGHLL